MQVTYPFGWAKVVHSAPLVVTLSLPFLQQSAFGHRSLASVYYGLALETMAALLSFASAIATGMFVGIFRVTALGDQHFLDLHSIIFHYAATVGKEKLLSM